MAPALALSLAAAAALGSAGLIRLLMPLLQRYALARPNARSSHRVPTPQGGGIAVIGAALFAVAAGLATGLVAAPWSLALAVFAATLVLAAVGAVDDLRPLSPLLRLLVQVLAVAAMLWALQGRVLPEAVPPVLERALLLLAGVWFVNLVNFMDGLDWITAAEIVPVTAVLALAGVTGHLPALPAALAAALCGAMLGFAPFNRPVARLFLGDVGSLPIGLITAYALFELAAAGHLAAAIILPLYHLADATLTLARRLARGEAVWQAHRSHFYQQATDNGFTVTEVSGTVFALNLALAALALLTLAQPTTAAAIPALALAALLVGATLRRFARPRRVRPA